LYLFVMLDDERASVIVESSKQGMSFERQYRAKLCPPGWEGNAGRPTMPPHAPHLVASSRAR
jgi:hypothetical protein